jgi:hypothetical protein
MRTDPTHDWDRHCREQDGSLSFECTGCGKECEGEPFSSSPPDHNSGDGIGEELCATCDQKRREWEKSVGLSFS